MELPNPVLKIHLPVPGCIHQPRSSSDGMFKIFHNVRSPVVLSCSQKPVPESSRAIITYLSGDQAIQRLYRGPILSYLISINLVTIKREAMNNKRQLHHSGISKNFRSLVPGSRDKKQTYFLYHSWLLVCCC